MKNYRIRGKRDNQKRGGAFYGISMDDNLPVFGGGNLMHAPIWWNKTEEEINAICELMKAKYHSCEFCVETLS